MANPNHLEIVKQGTNAVQAWRDQNPDAVFDLSEANLFRANLQNMNLYEANLRNADLIEADLHGAYLSRANFHNARLFGANLTRANLASAKLVGADLRFADLSGSFLGDVVMDFATLIIGNANLREANLGSAKLFGTDLRFAKLNAASLLRAEIIGASLFHTVLTSARFGWTILGDTDLSTAEDLDKVEHVGPSTVGIDTLYRSGRRLPEAFLQGCGVPGELISQLSSLIDSLPLVRSFSYFITYDHNDEEFSKKLHQRMRDEQLRAWLSPTAIPLHRRPGCDV